jgi:hypothetical protein
MKRAIASSMKRAIASSMKRAIGYAMLATPFAVGFGFVVASLGFPAAVLLFAGIAALIGFIVVGVEMTT